MVPNLVQLVHPKEEKRNLHTNNELWEGILLIFFTDKNSALKLGYANSRLRTTALDTFILRENRWGKSSHFLRHQTSIMTNFFKYFFCWCAPFDYLYFLSFQMNQNWVQKSFLAWLWHHFHLVYWIRWDSNPQPKDRESNLLTTRPNWRPKKITNFYLFSLRQMWFKQQFQRWPF